MHAAVVDPEPAAQGVRGEGEGDRGTARVESRSADVLMLLLLVFLGGGTEGDEVELDTLRQVHDPLDDLDRVLQQVSSGGAACQHRTGISLSFSLSLPRPSARATHLEQVLLNLAMVDGTVAPPVELDQVPVVVDKGDKVQIGVGFEGGSLYENNWAPRGVQSVNQKKRSLSAAGGEVLFSGSTPAKQRRATGERRRVRFKLLCLRSLLDPMRGRAPTRVWKTELKLERLTAV